MADEIKTWLTIGSVVVGAGWALMKIFFSQQQKIESLKEENTSNAIDRLNQSVKDLSTVITVHRTDVADQMGEMRKDIESLKIVQAAHISEIKAFGEIMAKIYRHYAGERDPGPVSEKKQIGKEAWIIRDKKKNGEDGG